MALWVAYKRTTREQEIKDLANDIISADRERKKKKISKRDRINELADQFIRNSEERKRKKREREIKKTAKRPS